jgi:hypothetical protein
VGSLTRASISGSPRSVGAGLRIFSIPLTVALAIVSMLILGSASASAQDNGHAFSFQIKPTGTAEFTGFEFCCPPGISAPYLIALAVDNSSGPSSGDIYVIDYYGDRVEKFDPEGHFILMFGDGVNQTTGGDVCTAASGNTCQKGTQGQSAEQFFAPQFIQVDPTSGDVYVGDTFQRKIHKYDENGNLITGYGLGGALSGSESTFRSILGMAVTGSGQLVVRACQQNFCNFGEHVVLVTLEPGGTVQSVVSTPSEDYEGAFARTEGGFMYYRGSYETTQYGLRRASSSDGSGVVNFLIAPYETPFNGFKGYVGAVATDPAGTVYAGMLNNEYPGPGRVWEWQVNGSGQPLDAEGNPCSVTLTASGPGCPPTHEFGSTVLDNSPHALATDANTGTLYVVNSEAKAIDAFIEAPEAIAATEGLTWFATAHGTADPDGAGDITDCEFQFGPTKSYGSSEECSAAGPLPFSSETAVSAELPALNGDGHHIYHTRLVVKNEAGAVSFGPDHAFSPMYVKSLLTQPAENITRTQATLKGSYDETGKQTEYFFEWGTSACPCANQSPLKEATSTDLGYLASTDGVLTHLKPQTVYHYRVVAENELGTTSGEDQTFETLPAVQSITTDPANPVERRKATAKGSFQGDGTQTSYTFEWGPTASYGNALEVQDGGSPNTLQHVAMVIDGCPENEPDPKGCLEPSYSNPANPAPKTYHYRISATNELGTTKGAGQEFTTLPAVASLKTEEATSIDQENVTLNGEFEGNGEDTNYYFEYGLTPEYGKTTETVDAGEPSGSKAVSSEITDYEAYETYHYRVVAKNAYGTTYGNDETFETEAALKPDIAGTQSSNVVPTGATLEAMVNPNRWLTVYAFEYGLTATYGETTEISPPIGADKSFHPVSSQISGLAPGTLYHFRAVAINFTGTTYGPDQALTTPDVPRIDLSSSSGIGQTVSHLNAAVSPNGSPTTVKFEYGITGAYGQATSPVSIGSEGAEHQVGADLSGLTQGTVYHFRAVASNEFGTTTGPDRSFTTQSATTPPPPPPPAELKCKKGFVKRHGRCVKRHHRKHHRGTGNGRG